MFQNHLLQLLTLIAMEPPATFDADLMRNEKVKLLKSVRPIEVADTVLAQYAGYREADGVEGSSRTPTFAAMKLYVDNFRWFDVPFYLRSGKALRCKHTEINVVFKPVPHRLFENGEGFRPNALSICVQPDEGIHLTFEAKEPDATRRTRSVEMEFHYADSFGETAIPEAYERLILDALLGDAALFSRRDGIEAQWELMDPVIQHWEVDNRTEPIIYDREDWGPDESEILLLRDGRKWGLNCVHED
jgi:glucose-6-phosphate 1-dehydrogenase